MTLLVSRLFLFAKIALGRFESQPTLSLIKLNVTSLSF